MASVTAFNDMLGQFLTELVKTFPEQKGLKKYVAGFEILRDTNPKALVNKFMSSAAPYADKISAKDESLFLDESSNFDFIQGFNIAECWPKASENTKTAIWQYLQTLYMLGTTITAIPPETLSMIETVAKQCADKMQNDGEGVDEAQLMSSMQKMLGGMLKK